MGFLEEGMFGGLGILLPILLLIIVLKEFAELLVVALKSLFEMRR